MDNAEIAVLVGGIVAIIGVPWFFFGTRAEETGAETAASGPLYACPMHSWITSDNAAANCSICGMKLILQGGESELAGQVKSTNIK